MKKLYVSFTLCLGAAAMLLVACGGSDADLEALATEAADMQPQTEVSVVAEGNDYDTDTIVVPAGQEVSLTLDNRDGGTLHNISVYTDGENSDRQEIYRGELFQGDEVKTYTFTAPEAGVYLFRCDAHPDMSGAFIAR